MYIYTLTTSTLFPNFKSFSHFLTNKPFGRPRSPRCDGSLTRPCSQLAHATKNITSLVEVKIVVIIMIMNYLQQDGATREAELDAVLWGIVPREELQVLYGAVGQWCLHVTGGLGRREDISLPLSNIYSTYCIFKQSRRRKRHLFFPGSELERQKETYPRLTCPG